MEKVVGFEISESKGGGPVTHTPLAIIPDLWTIWAKCDLEGHGDRQTRHSMGISNQRQIILTEGCGLAERLNCITY
jgi:hypothetical protein